MARVYATADDLVEWLGDYPPANVATLLTRASLLIDAILVGVCYAVDDDDLPIDTGVAGALKDAVCAQVAWWVSATPQPAVSGSEDAWPRLGRVGRPELVTATSGQPGRQDVAPDAVRALHVAGLQPAHPVVFG